MRVNNKLFYVVLIAASLNLSAHATYKEILEDMSSGEIQIQKLLDQFAKTGDCKTLEKASRILFSGYHAGEKEVDWIPVRNRLLVLRLKVLAACYEAKDPNFNIKTPFPPDCYPPMMLYGDEKDLEVIKKHDAAMAKYKAYRDRQNREIGLKKLYDKMIRRLRMYLEGINSNPKFSLNEDIATIKAVIKNEQLQKEILRPVSGITQENSKNTINTKTKTLSISEVNPVTQKLGSETNKVSVKTNNLSVKNP